MFLPGYTRLMLEMHKRQAIVGDFLCIGRQTAGFTYDEAKDFLRECGITPDLSRRVAYDYESAAGKHHNAVTKGDKWIDDHTFVSMFSTARVFSVDVSPYEKATIIHDMNTPIPEKYHGIANFIFEGSCIDNMFNPAQAMMNIDLMLRPNGRIFMVNAGNIVPKDTFVALGEEWYQGFLNQNKYKEVSVVTYSYDKVDDPVWTQGYPAPGQSCCVVVSAKKSAIPLAKAVQPIQQGYVDMHHPKHPSVLRAAAGHTLRYLGLR
jgi:hypothetical protein